MKRLLAAILIIGLSSVALFAGLFGGGSKRTKLVIKGSTTVAPIAQKCNSVFSKKNRNVSISMSATGSGDGVKSLIEKTCDVAMASRRMKDKEFAAAKSAGVKVEEHVVAIDMIVPIVHPSNPVSKISTKQLKDIFAGKITNWKQLGGKDETIVVFSRDSSSGTFETWEKIIMSGVKVTNSALIQSSNGTVLAGIKGNKKAIGYVGFGYLNRSVKGLSVNGIMASPAKKDKYAIARKLYMYTDRNNTNKAAKDYINFVKGSAGQKLVKEQGFVPLR